MSATHFRFLHASDFALHEPLRAVADAPPSIRELLVDAPFLAAERVFSAAVEERVDFVLLSGNLLDLNLATPRALAFLLDSFTRLESHGIAVYWAGGKLDPPQDWPPIARLPGSVQVFSPLDPEELSHFRGDRPVAHIVGRSWHGTSLVQVGDFKYDSDGLTTIVVAYGQATDVDRLTEQEVEYWALGGQPQRKSLGTNHRIVHYPGSPQGRAIDEPGPHGCTLVHVASDRSLRTQFIPTDAIRWHNESLAVSDDASRGDVRKLLAERIKLLRSQAEDRPLLVNWRLKNIEHLARPTKRHELAAELLEWLKKEYAGAKPAIWPVGVEFEPADLPAEWLAEDSMVGDYLRGLKTWQDLEPSQVDLAVHVPERHRTPDLASLADWTTADHRELLKEAALLGAQLLGADDRD
jgi:exonuclease SbcD